MDSPNLESSLVTTRDPGSLFHYPELDFSAHNVRLLRVNERQANERLNFTLEPVKLEESRFVALSYTWERPVLVRDKRGVPVEPWTFKSEKEHPSKTISVNGANFAITSNLHEFLQTVETSKLEGNQFYVDQICINQMDCEEVEQQVALMGAIYSRAAEVVAWIPPPLPLSWARQEQLRDSAFELSGDEKLRSFLLCPETHSLPVLQRTMLLQRAEQIGGILAFCFRSTYWERQWIVQEVILARQLVLQVGPYEFQWNTAFKAMGQVPTVQMCINLKFLQLSGSKEIAYRPLFYCVSLLNYKQQEMVESPAHRPRLSEALVRFAGRECTKQRDRVFGLFGLADTSITPSVGLSLSSLYLQVLCEGVEGLVAEHGEESMPKIIDFVTAAQLAIGYKIWDLAVALITSRVLANFSFNYEERKSLVVSTVGGILDPRILAAKHTVVDVLTSWVKMRYSMLAIKLRRAKASNKQLGIANVDHQTDIWTTEFKSYNGWLELVDSMTPRHTAQDWKYI